MEKVINWFNREQLINFNEKLEAVGQFMREVIPGDLRGNANELFNSMRDL